MTADAPFATSPFPYRVRYSKRRTLALYVYPDQRVEVRAPLGCADALIKGFVANKSAWVQRKLDEFSRHPPVNKTFDIQQPQPYLGAFYPLTIIPERPYGVWLAADRLQLRCRNEESVPRLLAEWYRRQAWEIFAQRLQVCRERMRHFDLPAPELKVRLMRRRWGSCASHGVITLNLDLVRYALHLIDYVIVHELCHLREFHHGPAFYRMMDAALPDWKEHKDALRQQALGMPPWPGRP